MLLSACSGLAGDPHTVDIGNAAREARADIANYAASAPVGIPEAIVSAPRRSSDVNPAATSSEASIREDGAQTAVATVLNYHALIAQGRFAQARKLWGDGGSASDMGEAKFAASFAKYASYRASTGKPGAIEAGAGQRYITIPVTVTGTLKADGARFRLVGPMTLHRVGDIDGATAEQRSWRISASALKPRPVS